MQSSRDVLLDLKLGSPGKAQLLVDGVDISNIAYRTEFTVEAGKIGQLVLYCRALRTQIVGVGDVVTIALDENAEPPPLRRAEGWGEHAECEVCGAVATSYVVDALIFTALNDTGQVQRPLFPAHHYCADHNRPGFTYSLNRQDAAP
jgi:hypothetical protein